MKQLNRCFYIAIILFFSPVLYAKTHSVAITNNYFIRPDNLKILEGDTIRFENVSDKPITLYFFHNSYVSLFDSVILSPSNAFEHTPSTFDRSLYYTDALLPVPQLGSIRIYEKPLIISPRDSMLLGKKEFSVTVFYTQIPPPPSFPTIWSANSLHSHISLILDKKIIYDGDFLTFLNSALVSEKGDVDNKHYFIVTAPKNSLAPGLHTFQVQSKDSSILYDEVHYTVK